MIHPHNQVAGLDTQRVHRYALCAARNPSQAQHHPSEAQCGPLSRIPLWVSVSPYRTKQQTYWVDVLQVLVGGALAAGFKLTSRLLGTTPRESVDRQARAATSSSQPGTIDIEAKVQRRPKPSAFGQISGLHIELAFILRRHIYNSLACIERSPSPAPRLPCLAS